MIRSTLSSLVLGGFLMAGLTCLSGCGGDQKSGNQVEVNEAQQKATAADQAATESFYKEQMSKKKR